jgi:hypothetical protein
MVAFAGWQSIGSCLVAWHGAFDSSMAPDPMEVPNWPRTPSRRRSSGGTCASTSSRMNHSRSPSSPTCGRCCAASTVWDHSPTPSETPSGAACGSARRGPHPTSGLTSDSDRRLAAWSGHSRQHRDGDHYAIVTAVPGSALGVPIAGASPDGLTARLIPPRLPPGRIDSTFGLPRLRTRL